MWRGMMVPNVCANLSSGEAPDFRFERTLCRLKKNRNLFIIMSNSQNAYLELLLKKDCSESRRFRHTLCGWMDVASALTLPVPYGCAHGNTLASRWGSLTSRARADYRERGGATRTLKKNKTAFTNASSLRLCAPEAILSRIRSSRVFSSMSTELLWRCQVNPSPTDSTSNLTDLCLATISSKTVSWLNRMGWPS